MTGAASQAYANLAMDAYKDYPTGRFLGTDAPRTTIEGVDYVVRFHANNPKTGYQGTVYQRVDTGEIVVAHRGTEEVLKDGVLTDGGMVLARANLQAGDAIELTDEAIRLARSKEMAMSYGTTQLPVAVTGHSLGGTLAQISAHHYNLHGETFNAYGAASLGLRIPEGGDTVLNHVMAGDAVSSASPHFGRVQVHALPQEIQALEKNGYDNQRHWSDALRGYSPLQVATGMTPPRTTAAAVAMGGSHSMHHFVNVDANGRPDVSVLQDPKTLALASESATAIGEYRQDVRTMRSVITVVARGINGAIQDGIDAARGPMAPGEPAERQPGPLGSVSWQLLNDSRNQVRTLSERHGLPWDQGMENTACAVALCARQNGLSRISHLTVADGQIRLAQLDGAVLKEGRLDAREAANTPVEQSVQGLQTSDRRQADVQQPVAGQGPDQAQTQQQEPALQEMAVRSR